MDILTRGEREEIKNSYRSLKLKILEKKKEKGENSKKVYLELEKTLLIN